MVGAGKIEASDEHGWRSLIDCFDMNVVVLTWDQKGSDGLGVGQELPAPMSVHMTVSSVLM